MISISPTMLLLRFNILVSLTSLSLKPLALLGNSPKNIIGTPDLARSEIFL